VDSCNLYLVVWLGPCRSRSAATPGTAQAAGYSRKEACDKPDEETVKKIKALDDQISEIEETIKKINVSIDKNCTALGEGIEIATASASALPFDQNAADANFQVCVPQMALYAGRPPESSRPERKPIVNRPHTPSRSQP